MSASDSDTSVTLTDERETVREKIEGAYCPAGEVEDNGVLEYLEHLVFPVLRQDRDPFRVERPEEYGGDLVYEDYETLETDFISGELHPADLKPATGDAISAVIGPVRDRLLEDPELLASAYPDEYAE